MPCCAASGLAPLRWLGEPSGVFALLASGLGITLPGWAGRAWRWSRC